ncbi:type I-F CRISPR-associated protein Csy1 [Gilliamella sp. Pra-s65]|uniref:type I-F CRISPR-associated protein Csy1 n=1 Tax=unclassified Gilliamella TaxID=2685620 RepID=UPI0013665A77|nr:MULTISPECIES: type I-F CRISPR-associated protein Csy1 [unclassified Gilliamella]MWN90105.1 type I-F CRISPR-associated protein Csy1 [Gilliamella sp. Pra-s65]MWP73212.1 type I-F CRISPR-associated protein Csy1 [Gilliamella sp. Pra-s52]
MDNISRKDIRKSIEHILAKFNSKEYGELLSKLEKAKLSEDINLIVEYELQIKELSKNFEFDVWMENFINEKVKGTSVVTHSGKGAHTAIKHCNINYILQTKPKFQHYISSATQRNLSFDCTNNAARITSVFNFLNQTVKDNITLFQLIVEDHPEILNALSDDNQKATKYLDSLKKALSNDFENLKSSDLNKQIFWPNSEDSYLSQQENNYRLLMPLYPNSLCYAVFQKIQTRNSEENKKSRIQRSNKDIEHNSYFSFNELAVLKLGGTKPLNVGQLNQLQNGRNFLLPSMPPKFEKSQFPSIGKQQETIFNHSLQYFCRFGFKLLFDMVKAPKNIVEERDNRKDAFDSILKGLFQFARHIQMTMPAGWSREFSLKMAQKLWLDPKRARLEDEEEFKQKYEQGNWLVDLEDQFAFWIQTILKNKFDNIKEQFSDPEYREWIREFKKAVKVSQLKKQGVF